MLKAWIANPDLSQIEIEDKYTKYAGESRVDRFATVTWNILHVRSTYQFGGWQLFVGVLRNVSDNMYC